MLVIVLKRPNGDFDHMVHGRGDDDTRRYFELLKETRSVEKIPIMELHDITIGEPLETHVMPKHDVQS